MSESEISLGEAALWYAREMGWAVFPVRAQGKQPITGNGVKDATTDLERIGEWWAKYPNANIGLACGGPRAPSGQSASGVWCLDVDGPEGVDTLEALTAENGALPETVEGHTGGGGRHYFFAWDPERPQRNTAKRLGPGLDTRGEGGYVILPPSVHPSGRPYLFESSSRPKEVAIAAAPDWLYGALGRPKDAEETHTPSESIGDADAGIMQRARAYLGRIPPAVAGQGGDEHTFKTAAKLREFGISEPQAFDLMLSDWNDGCSPPWAARDLRKKVANAYAYGSAVPGVKARTGRQHLANIPPPTPDVPAGAAAGDLQVKAPNGAMAGARVSNYKSDIRWTLDKKAVAEAGKEIGPGAVKVEAAELKYLARRARFDELSGPEAERFDVLFKKYSATSAPIVARRDIDDIRRRITAVTGGWPQRIRAPGAEKPILFFDPGRGTIDQVTRAKRFLAILHGYAEVRFNHGQDKQTANYVTVEEVFESFAVAPEVEEWLTIETAPHWPPYERHYYSWLPPEGYVPDGRYLAQFVALFDNVASPAHRAILAAAVVTLFWGGPYEGRPVFVFDADQRGSGKTTAANLIAQLLDVMGPLVINLDKRSEERLKERLLSPEGLTKRVALIDNVKGTVNSELLEELVTCVTVSGKRLAVGEASRPNTLTYFITANGVQLSPDMARRAFYVFFDPLEGRAGGARASWKRGADAFVKEHGKKIVADCLWVLGKDNPGAEAHKKIDWEGGGGDFYELWAQEVLAPTLAVGAVQEAVGVVSALESVRGNQKYRDETDMDIEESRTFMQGLLERVCSWQGYRLAKGLNAEKLPAESIFIRTQAPPKKSEGDFMGEGSGLRWLEHEALASNNMVAYWRSIFENPKASYNLVTKVLKKHIAAGRMEGLTFVRRRDQRGWVLDDQVIVDFIGRTEGDG